MSRSKSAAPDSRLRHAIVKHACRWVTILVTPIPKGLQVAKAGNQTLYCSVFEQRAIEVVAATAIQVNQLEVKSPGRDRVLVLVQAPGASPLLDLHPYGRNYLHLPGFVRPYDHEQLLGEIETLRAVILLPDGSGVRSADLTHFEQTLSTGVVTAMLDRVRNVENTSDGMAKIYWIGPDGGEQGEVE